MSTLSLFDQIPSRPLVICRASAGSGKTFKLVQTYIRLALAERFAFRNILAITFTNKAAAEMKQRLFDALQAFSAMSGEDLPPREKALAEQLKKDLGWDSARLKAASGQLLTDMLHRYSDVAIGTVDSFSLRILRAFSVELGLPRRFTVELRERWLAAEITRRVLSEIGRDPSLTDFLVDFAFQKAEDEKSWHIDRDLEKFVLSSFRESTETPLRSLSHWSLDDFWQLSQKYLAEIRLIEQTIRQVVGPALNYMQEHGITDDHFHQKGKGLGKYFEKVLEDPSLEKLIPGKLVSKGIAEDQWAKVPAAARLVFRQTYDQLQAEIPNAERAQRMRLILDHVPELALLTVFERFMKETLSDTGALPISDFNKIIARVVRDEPVPFIYERLTARFRSFLIDEFQDTSVLQWQNLLPMIHEALAQPGSHGQLLVGDAKQAIYRFRNGDAEQFIRLPEISNPNLEAGLAEEYSAGFSRSANVETLGLNYRSGRVIIAFVNEFYKMVAEAAPELAPTYADQDQSAARTKDEGFVSVQFATGADKPTLQEEELKLILPWIQRALDDGYAYKDIALLTRTRDEGVVIADHLARHKPNWPIATNESLLLMNSLEVQTVLSLLQLLRRPEDRILKGQCAHLLNEQIGQKPDPKTLNTVVTGPFKDFIAYLQHLVGRPIPFYQWQLLSLYEQATTVTQWLSHEGHPTVLQFLDAILDFVTQFPGRDDAFFIWWEENKWELSVGMTDLTDGIRILTIHKAKGLEFPVVMLPFADWDYSINREPVWFQPEPEEGLPFALVNMSKKLNEIGLESLFQSEMKAQEIDNLNLLYVAMTRAMDRLIMIANGKERNGEYRGNIREWFHRFANQLGAIRNIERGSLERAPARPSRYAPGYDKTPLDRQPWRERVQLRTIGAEQAVFGTFVHRVLSRIRSAKDLESVLDDVSASGSVEQETMLQVAETVKRVLSDKTVAPLFAGQQAVGTEVEILDKEGRIRRLDRVIFEKDRTLVIDFKTGEDSDTASHQKQIHEYLSLLTSLGCPGPEGRLVYTANPVHVEIVRA